MSIDPQLKTKISLIVARSRESLLIAYQLHDQSHYNDAVSKAYYGVFHALQAALLTKNLSFSKHSGVMAAFNKEFVSKGLFPKHFSQRIARLFRDRLVGDYEYNETIGQEDCQQDLTYAKEIALAIEEYLTQEGFLNI